MTRKTITDAIELVGAAVFTIGVGMAWLPAGVITAGIVLVLGSFLAGDE